MDNTIKILCRGKIYAEIIIALLDEEEKSTYSIAKEYNKGESASSYAKYAKILADETKLVTYRKGESNRDELIVKLNYDKFLDLFFYINRHNQIREPMQEDKNNLVPFFKLEDIRNRLKRSIVSDKAGRYHFILFLYESINAINFTNVFNSLFQDMIGVINKREITRLRNPDNVKNLQTLLDEYFRKKYGINPKEAEPVVNKALKTWKRVFGHPSEVMEKMNRNI